MYSDKEPSADTLRALEMAPNIYLVLSTDLYILAASDLFLEATETTREAIMGRYLFDAFPEDFSGAKIGTETINFSIQEALKTKKRHQLPVTRYDVPDQANPGQFIQKYWHPSHTPVLDEYGKVQFIIQLADSVTEQVVLQKALEKATIQQQKTQESLCQLNDELVRRVHSESHFRQLADLIPTKVSNALSSGEVTYFNKQWLDYSNLSFEELRDFGYHNMMHPDEVAGFQECLKEAAITGEPLEMEMRFINGEGEYRWHLNIASPVFDEKGEIIMWVGSTTDIQRIKEEEQRKTDFIGMVSHELKTPLTSINAYLQILHGKAAKLDDAFTTDALNKSINHVRKMTKMVNGFLNVSMLESGKMQVEKQRFDLNELVREVVHEFKAIIRTHKLIIGTMAEVYLLADRDKISLVIHNLISNAVKYSPAGTTIRVACTVANNSTRVSVQDEGPGIRPEDQHKLFERFFRGSGHSTTISGFGIGLYLCSEIINCHEGEIWLLSEVGKGSTFCFSLPLDDSRAVS